MDLAATYRRSAVQHAPHAREHAAAPRRARRQARRARTQAARRRHSLVGAGAGGGLGGRGAGEGGALSRGDPAAGRPGGDVGAVQCRFLDGSTRHAALRDFRDEVHAQKGNLGSFEELLKTVDPEPDGRGVRPTLPGRPHSLGARARRRRSPTVSRNGTSAPAPTAASSSAAASRPWTICASSSIYVVPELQRRGLSKRKYAGPTLRENLNG